MDSYYLNKLKFLARHPLRYKKLNKLTRPDGQYSVAPYYKTGSIFVHIPKAAGVSLSSSLYGNYGGGHCTISDYRYIFNRNDFESFFKFAFVRNPWDRLWSAYRFLQTGGFGLKDKKWFDENIAKYPNFEAFVMEWLSEDNIYSYPHFIPQKVFITLPESSEISIDFPAYYENLHNDFELICSKLKLDVPLVHKNKTQASKSQLYSDVYSPDMINKVEQIYQQDVDLLGYEFSNSHLKKQIGWRDQHFPLL